MKRPLYIFATLILILNYSCISSYNAIAPAIKEMPLEKTTVAKGINFMVSDDNLLVLNEVFDKKAQKKGIRLISVQIENNTDSLVMLSMENLEVFNDFEPVRLLSPKEVVSKTGYNLFGRGALVAVCIAGSFQIGSVTSGLLNFYSPLLYSTPFSIFYFTRSLISNNKFKEDIEKYYPDNKKINPGEKINCIIAFESENRGEILIRFRN